MIDARTRDELQTAPVSLQALGRRIPFAFLDDIKDRFTATYGSAAAQQAIAYEFNTEFSQTLKQRMHYFATDPNADAISRVRGGVAEVKNIMVENIEKVKTASHSLQLHTQQPLNYALAFCKKHHHKCT